MCHRDASSTLGQTNHFSCVLTRGLAACDATRAALVPVCFYHGACHHAERAWLASWTGGSPSIAGHASKGLCTCTP